MSEVVGVTRRDYLKSTFGAKLKAKRQSKKLTLRNLAIRVGVDYTSLSNLESGRFSPSEDLVKRLAIALEENPLLFCRIAGIVPSEYLDVILDLGEFRDIGLKYGLLKVS